MRTVPCPLRIVAAAVSVLLLACGAEEPREPATSPADAALLRIATWNVHDLFDAVDRASPPGDKDLVPTPAEVEAKLQRVGGVLARLEADVLVLEEVEGVELLERLAAGALAGRGYRSFLREGYDPRGIDVGVLSRLPFEPGPSHLEERAADGRRLWARDLLEVKIPWDDGTLLLLGAHLVSRLDPAEDERRREQAVRIGEIARDAAADPSTVGVLVAGDLNDLPGSAALAPLLRDPACLDAGGSLPPAEAWTWSGGGARERIDYALLCHGVAAVVTRVEVKAWQQVTDASDHRPLVVDLWTAAGP